MSVAMPSSHARIDWVDCARGLSIVLVVLMHSTYGVEVAAGRESWMHAVALFATPFRIPTFFMVSGLFVARVIDLDWDTYIDRKVVYFAYFYVLWVSIQFAFKAPASSPSFAHAEGWLDVGKLYLQAFVQPFFTLWFIYLLPIFFVVTKLVRRCPPLAVWLVAAALQIATIESKWVVVDEFTGRFVYFYTGYVCASWVFSFAATVQARPRLALSGLAVWAIVNQLAIGPRLDNTPFISLALSSLGMCAMVAVAALLAKYRVAAPLRYCGRQSLIIYLAWFLPEIASRIFLLRTGLVPDVGTVCLIVAFNAVVGALLVNWMLKPTPLRFLFARPDWLGLPRARAHHLHPAE